MILINEDLEGQARSADRARLAPKLLLFSIIFVWGAYLRLVNFTSPFPDNYHGFNAGYMSLIARNWVRHGIWNLSFFQVVDGGPLVAGSELYTHHPPLVPLLVWVWFTISGSFNEWCARIVPITFSMGAWFLVCLLAQRLWCTRVALLAGFVYAILPYASYFGNDVCYETGSQFFLLLIVYWYVRYMESQRFRDFAWMCVSLALGALNDWPAFFTVPLLGLHWWFRFHGKRRLYCLLYPAVAAVMGGLFLATIAKAEGTWWIPQLAALLPYASKPEGVPPGPSYNLFQWLNQVVMVYLRYYCTPPVLGLGIWWVIGFLIRWFRRQVTDRDFILILLWLYAVLYVGLGHQWAYTHPYWASVLLPGLSIAAAVVLNDLLNRLAVRLPLQTPLPRGLILATLLLFGLYCSYRLFRLHSQTPMDYRIALMMKEKTGFNDHILISSRAGDPMVLRFYADRNIYFGINSLEIFSAIAPLPHRATSWANGPPLETVNPNINFGRPGPAYCYFFMADEHQTRFSALYRFMQAAYRRRTIPGFTIFDLKDPLISEEAMERLIAAPL